MQASALQGKSVKLIYRTTDSVAIEHDTEMAYVQNGAAGNSVRHGEGGGGRCSAAGSPCGRPATRTFQVSAQAAWHGAAEAELATRTRQACFSALGDSSHPLWLSETTNG